jgi:hypothetical protein
VCAEQEQPWRGELIGYDIMTLSPVENAHMTMASIAAFIRSERAR